MFVRRSEHCSTRQSSQEFSRLEKSSSRSSTVRSPFSPLLFLSRILILTSDLVDSAAFNAGTILAISAVEDGISENPDHDVERRQAARRDLKFIVASLKEIGVTWTTANTSAGVLEGEHFHLCQFLSMLDSS